MADDDVLERPGVAELLANPKRYHPPEHPAAPAGTVQAQSRAAPSNPQTKTPAPPPAGPEPAKAEEAPPLGSGPESFDPAGADYKAFGWAGNKTVPTLLLIFEDGRQQAVVYAQLDSDPAAGSEFLPAAPGKKGSVIRLRVAGSARVFFVVLEGVRVQHVWQLLMAHKTPWIRVLPPGAVPLRDEAVIWSIRFEPAE